MVLLIEYSPEGLLFFETVMVPLFGFQIVGLERCSVPKFFPTD